MRSRVGAPEQVHGKWVEDAHLGPEQGCLCHDNSHDQMVMIESRIAAAA